VTLYQKWFLHASCSTSHRYLTALSKMLRWHWRSGLSFSIRLNQPVG
jgi:hypothetical protein